MNNNEKLKDQRWENKRIEILNKRGCFCEICGGNDSILDIHHRFYIRGREPWEYDNDVFQILCRNCHNRVHRGNNGLPEEYGEIVKIIEQNKNKVTPIELEQLLMVMFNHTDNIFLSRLSLIFTNGEHVDELKSRIEEIYERIKQEFYEDEELDCDEF